MVRDVETMPRHVFLNARAYIMLFTSANCKYTSLVRLNTEYAYLLSNFPAPVQ